MYKLLIVFLFAVFIFSCSPSFDNGSVVIQTPSYIDGALSKNISGNIIDISNEDNFRYEIAVESNNKTINFVTLKGNEAKSFSVPPNVPLSFKVGIYYAINSDSTYERYNAYIGTDRKENVVVAAGETRELVFDVKLNKNLLVDNYIDSTFGVNGVASILSGFQGNDGVYFSAKPLVDSGDSEYKVLKYSSGAFKDFSIDGVNASKFFTFKDAPDDKKVWFATKKGLYLSDSTFSKLEAKFSWTDFSSVSDIKGFGVKSKDSSEKDRYYYLFDRGGSSFYSINYGLKASDYLWSSLGDVDLSSLPLGDPSEPLLLDIEQEAFPNDNKIFFATKIGLFYIDENFFADILGGDTPEPSKIMSSIKKVIKVENPNNKDETILIRKIKSNGSDIYLGSKEGLYRIDRNSSEWKEFADSSSKSFVELKQGAITKVSGFDYDESISSMQITTDNVLVVSTPKRIWFKNLSSGKTSEISVWDGLPFIPLKGYSNGDKFDVKNYGTHYMAPVKSVFFDSINSKYWIVTSYGIASVDRDKLF